mmetsp:Transcript_5844/g.9955  ORF Transcript_5844/g.9955 Transcript_5844/m.9955 type:complete len:241 (-) Transcript_5844:3167-3889(-)
MHNAHNTATTISSSSRTITTTSQQYTHAFNRCVDDDFNSAAATTATALLRSGRGAARIAVGCDTAAVLHRQLAVHVERHDTTATAARQRRRCAAVAAVKIRHRVHGWFGCCHAACLRTTRRTSTSSTTTTATAFYTSSICAVLCSRSQAGRCGCDERRFAVDLDCQRRHAQIAAKQLRAVAHLDHFRQENDAFAADLRLGLDRQFADHHRRERIAHGRDPHVGAASHHQALQRRCCFGFG